MALSKNRVCVFCGQKPTTKTREHIVPYWLLERTGDPKRVVRLGINYAKKKAPIEFAWSQYVAPACDACNNKYSQLETRVKGIVTALENREAITVSAYLDLLDWLDKIRVGAWLLRRLLENNPLSIEPNFHISSRVGRKDRMLALYAFGGDGKGINLFGNDSMISGSMPSCFGLRVNNILMLNVSSDFFCSKGCGFPYPEDMKFVHGGPDHGAIWLRNFKYARDIGNPITDLKLRKPVVWLYQAIKQPSNSKEFQGGYIGHYNAFDSRIASRTLGGIGHMGAVFRQYSDRVEMLNDLDANIEFDNVTGADTAALGDIVGTIYETQSLLFERLEEEWVQPAEPSEFDKALRNLKLSSNAEFAELYRKQSQ